MKLAMVTEREIRFIGWQGQMSKVEAEAEANGLGKDGARCKMERAEWTVGFVICDM